MSTSKKISSKLRSSFINQAGHFIIIDVGHPMTNESKNKIVKSLKSVILLTGHLISQRIPAFGIATLDKTYNKLHSISSIKGDLNEILKCFDELFKRDTSGTKITIDDYSSQLSEAVHDIMKDFIIKSESVKTKNKIWLNWPSQILITLVTAKKASPIMEILFDIVNLNNNSPLKLKQIDVLEVKPEDDLKFCNAIHKNGFISYTSSIDNSASLDTVFKKWLLEMSSYDEQIRIIVNKELDLVIKCDINDVIINPDTLPFGHRFRLGSCYWFSGASGGEGSNYVQIYELRVIKRIIVSSLDMGYTFGYPQRLRPTNCWKLSLNEIYLNKELFQTLQLELKESHVGLLAELQYEGDSSNAMTTYFFITTDADGLLIKSIAPAELLLPSNSELSNNVSDEAKILMRKSLEKFPISENYSPQNFKSNLYNCIEMNVKETPPRLSNSLKYKSQVQLQSPNRKKKCEEKNNSQMEASLDNLEPGEYVPDFVSKKLKGKITKSPRKIVRKKILSGCKHPALLPAEVKEALRNKNFAKEFSSLDLQLGDAEFLK